MKFNIGDKLHIIGDIKITGEQSHSSGSYSYNTNLGVAFPAYVLEQLTAASVEPQDKPEAIKLYCVKDRCPGYALTKGKIYTFDGHRLDYDELKCFYANDFEDYKRGDWSYADYLVPLVSRPAKAGEWVLVTEPHSIPTDDNGIADYKKGDILKIIETNCCWFRYAEGSRNGRARVLTVGEYEVLDGYDGRYEQTEQPKLYSGKVVCVEARFPLTNSFTAGKVYTFENGKVADNDGDARPLDDAMETLDEWNEKHGGMAKFIEYKGEAT